MAVVLDFHIVLHRLIVDTHCDRFPDCVEIKDCCLPLVIGRQEFPCPDVSIEYPSGLERTTSRRQAELSWNGNDFVITDIGSRNGTFVNYVRVIESAIRDGDLLCFGGGMNIPTGHKMWEHQIRNVEHFTYRLYIKKYPSPSSHAVTAPLNMPLEVRSLPVCVGLAPQEGVNALRPPSRAALVACIRATIGMLQPDSAIEPAHPCTPRFANEDQGVASVATQGKDNLAEDDAEYGQSSPAVVYRARDTQSEDLAQGDGAGQIGVDDKASSEEGEAEPGSAWSTADIRVPHHEGQLESQDFAGAACGVVNEEIRSDNGEAGDEDAEPELNGIMSDLASHGHGEDSLEAFPEGEEEQETQRVNYENVGQDESKKEEEPNQPFEALVALEPICEADKALEETNHDVTQCSILIEDSFIGDEEEAEVLIDDESDAGSELDESTPAGVEAGSVEYCEESVIEDSVVENSFEVANENERPLSPPLKKQKHEEPSETLGPETLDSVDGDSLDVDVVLPFVGIHGVLPTGCRVGRLNFKFTRDVLFEKGHWELALFEERRRQACTIIVPMQSVVWLRSRTHKPHFIVVKMTEIISKGLIFDKDEFDGLSDDDTLNTIMISFLDSTTCQEVNCKICDNYTSFLRKKTGTVRPDTVSMYYLGM